MLIIVYWVMTFCCCVYASWVGGSSGRIGALLVVAKTIGNAVLTYKVEAWQHTSFPLFGLDILCLIGFLWLSLRSNCFWPLWAAACQLLAAISHAGTIWAPDATPMAYQAIRDMWAIPMQIFMVRGIMKDEQARMQLWRKT